MEADYKHRLEEAFALIEEQKKECARLTNEVSELSRRCFESENSLAESQRRLEAALAELADHESVDRKLEEFDKMLSGVEDMKRNYEKRIRTLEAKLRNEKKKWGADDSDELIEPIDMRARGTAPSGRVSPRFGVIAPKEDISSKGGVGKGEDKVSGRRLPVDRRPGKQEADDWLLELPSDL